MPLTAPFTQSTLRLTTATHPRLRSLNAPSNACESIQPLKPSLEGDIDAVENACNMMALSLR